MAFAGNSLFCRLALGSNSIDAASFTLVRLVAGAAALTLLGLGKGTPARDLVRLDVVATLALFGYAAAFSFAYRDLSAGTGALLLFGAVQLTMIGTGLFRGERPAVAEWLGLALALGGLGWLLAPGVAAPPWRGAALMILAGASWGIYSLRGRRVREPLRATTANFLWAVPPALLLRLVTPGTGLLSVPGIVWAVSSGALASGLGYAVWYSVLPRLSSTRAATVQLTVPILAALGGVVLLAETISLRLALAAALVLGGVALAIFTRRRV